MRIPRRMGVVAALAATSLVLSACGGDTDDGDGGGDAGGGGDVDCAAFEQYGDLSGTEVSVYTSIRTGRSIQ